VKPDKYLTVVSVICSVYSNDDQLLLYRSGSKDALEDDRQRATKYSNLALDEQLEAERHTSLDRRHQRTSIDPV